jgi:hypothetical protein
MGLIKLVTEVREGLTVLQASTELSKSPGSEACYAPNSANEHINST